MYLPEHFHQTDPALLHRAIVDHPLGALVTLTPAGLTADHIPFLWEPRGEQGTLIGHVARNNPVWRLGSGVEEALVIFQGPAHYISPNWYPSKQETHEVVPTYNYLVVHAHGPLQIHEDEKWLRGVVGKLTKHFESSEPQPWKMADAPRDYLQSMLADIVGVEIPITRLTGKWKVNQNRLPQDRAGVVAALHATGTAADLTMANLVAESLSRGT